MNLVNKKYDDDQGHESDNYIKKLVSLDERVKLSINDKNIGAGRSRNKGIEQSKGMILAFVDADDLWLKNKLEEQIKFMQDQAITFCHTSYKIINEKGEFISSRKARNFMTINDLIKSCDIGLSTVLIEKDTIGSNKFPEIKTKEDFVLWLQLLSKDIRIYGLDKELVLWRKTKNSLSSSLFQKMIDGYKVYNIYMKYNMVKSFYYLLCLSINFLKK